MFSDKERGVFNALKAAFTKAPVLQYCHESTGSPLALLGILKRGCDGSRGGRDSS